MVASGFVDSMAIITLRNHQLNAVTEAIQSWDKGNKNVLVVLPTGAGKTLVKAEFARRAVMSNEIGIAFAHRDVLLGQISDAMCMMNVRHSFIAAQSTIRAITNVNLEKYGDSYFDETSPIIIASVPTTSQRLAKGQLDHLIPLVKWWWMDEAHHTLANNQWGKCVLAFTNAKGLGVTATPIRGDGKGLGRGVFAGQTEPEEILNAHGQLTGWTEPEDIYDNDGVFHDMFVGSTMGELIEKQYLSPYKIYTQNAVDVSGIKITAGGDFNQNELAKRTDKSDITGDVVQHYLDLAAGQQTITFCVNIAHSINVAKEFNAAGILSVALSSKTPMAERNKAIIDFRAGRITNLVNSDLFGEGFDCPAVSCVIMLRKTESYSLFKQQFGRALRVIEGKSFGILIDHVGNVPRHCTHGAPHDDPEWSLERRKKRSKGDDTELPVGRICTECGFWSVPTKEPHICPDCGHSETEEERIEAVQNFQAKAGKLIEMDVDFIKALMVKRKEVDKSPEEVRNYMQHAPAVARNGAVNLHTKRQFAQNELRFMMQKWCSDMSLSNRWDITTTQREFEIEFKVNILNAQVLSERLTLELTERIKNEYM